MSCLKICVYIFLLLSAVFVNCIKLSPKNSLVWGPGLQANFQMPTRYFYVQLVDTKGKNITKSMGNVEISASTEKGRVRMHVKTFDRQDGTYIVNYRPTTPVKDLILRITINNEGIASSPYTVKGYIYQENCNCPMDTSSWLASLQCPETFGQLEEDLAPFPVGSVDMREVEQIIHEKFPKRPGNGALMHYVIKNNRVYRKDVGSITGFKMFTDNILLSLARKIHLPDVELFFNLGDWPLVKNNQPPFPVISWCGSTDTKDIILPTYDITTSVLNSISGVTLDMLSVQGNTEPKWSNKMPKALFRGRDSRKERLYLAGLSKEGDNSEILDAAITAFFFFPKNETLMSERVAFFDFFKYKYQINVDGTVAAYRFPYLLAGDSVILKQDSPYYEHFYRDLKPWEHFVPLKRDLSDVIEQINWAMKHDKEAQKIARNAQAYARDHLTPNNIYCYHYQLLERFSKIIKSKVEVLEGMEEAEHPTYMATCDCHRKKLVKDEL